MADITALKTMIHNKGVSVVALARNSGIERATLYNRFNGIGEFTASEIVKISNALNMSRDERDHIFLS